MLCTLVTRDRILVDKARSHAETVGQYRQLVVESWAILLRRLRSCGPKTLLGGVCDESILMKPERAWSMEIHECLCFHECLHRCFHARLQRTLMKLSVDIQTHLRTRCHPKASKSSQRHPKSPQCTQRHPQAPKHIQEHPNTSH